MKTILSLVVACCLFSGTAYANNVQITNVSILNGGPGAIQVQFSLSWDNSWRTNIGPNNYDGVWVFFKYKTAAGDWAHINLKGTGNIIPTGFEVYQNSELEKTGAMIHRSATNLGNGNVSMTNVRLGVVNTLPYDIDVRAMAIEMVFVPTMVLLNLGDDDGTNESTFALHRATIPALPFVQNVIGCDANAMDDNELEVDGILLLARDSFQLTNPFGTFDPFPTNGASWCMKYELSQAGYKDFLNTLTPQQQTTRTAFAPTSVRNTGALTPSTSPNNNFIRIDTPAIATKAAVYGLNRNNNAVFNEADDGEWLACNFLLWPDLAAFMDWSGLAPMTEIQFELMCRGSSSAGGNPSTFGEYAWGNTSIFASTYTLTSAGTASELASNASVNVGNAIYNATSSFPTRNGIFATSTSNRTTSGATFYGIMEMSGSVNEYCIGFGNVAGRSCGSVPNGDGSLAASGNAQLSRPIIPRYWPGMEGNTINGNFNTCTVGGSCEVTGVAGIRLRGGGATSPSTGLSISDRSSTFQPTFRGSDRGGRGILNIR